MQHSYEKTPKLRRTDMDWFYRHYGNTLPCFVCKKQVKSYFYPSFRDKNSDGLYAPVKSIYGVKLLYAIAKLCGVDNLDGEGSAYYHTYHCCGIRCINRFIEENRSAVLISLLESDSAT
jgi:hypothetical protein